MSEAQSEAYRKAVRDMQELRVLINVLSSALHREAAVSTDPDAAGRLQPVLARLAAREAPTSPRRRATDPAAWVVPVVPTRIVVLADEQQTVAPARPVPPSRIVEVRRPAVPLPRPQGGKVAAATPSSSSVFGSRSRSFSSPSPAVALEKQSFLVQHFVLSRCPSSAVGALARCSRACRDMVARWRTLSARTNLILEILSSEQTYLNMIREACSYKKQLVSRKFVDEKELDMFNNLPVLSHVSKKLLQALLRKMEKLDETTTVGDVFLHMMSELRVFKAYASAYQSGLATMARLLSQPESKAFLESRKAGSRLDGLLVAPVQRLPRYMMLLKSLSKATPATHADSAHLMAAVKGVAAVLALVEDGMKQSAVSDWSDIQFMPSSVMDNRVLKIVQSGEATWLHKKRLIAVRFVLFDQLFMLAYSKNGQWNFLGSLGIRNSMLSLHRDDGKLEGSSTFFLSLSSMSLSGLVLLFSVASEQLQSQWLSVWKRQSADQAQKEFDETCVAFSNKLQKLLPSSSLLSLSSSSSSLLAASSDAMLKVVKSGYVDMKKTQKIGAFKKHRYLLLTPDGFTYYTKQNGQKLGHFKLPDVQAVQLGGETGEFHIRIGTASYTIRASSLEEASSWVGAFSSLLTGRRTQNTVTLLFGDGSRGVVEVGEGDTAGQVIERACVKRRELDPSAAELWTTEGLRVERRTEAADLRGRVLRLTEGGEGKKGGRETAAVNEIDGGAPCPSPRRQEKVVRVEAPAGSSTRYAMVSVRAEADCGEVLVTALRKMGHEGGAEDWFLFDAARQRTLERHEKVVSGQQLRLVPSSSECDSATILDAIFSFDGDGDASTTVEGGRSLDSRQMYVGSVATGMRGNSPLKRSATHESKK